MPSAPSRGRLVKRLLSFGGLQAANAVVPLLVLPVVIGLIGPEGWVSLANGMGVGAAAAVMVGLAWPITGPPRVAGVSDAEAGAVLCESLVMRLMVLLPVCALATGAVVLLTPHGVHPGLGVAMAIATALNGLTSNWYYIGRGRAGGIMAFETVPKLVATALSIPVVMWTHEAFFYPLLLAVAAVGGTALSTWTITRWRGVRSAVRPAWRALGSQLPLGLAGVLSTGSTAFSVPVATLSGAGVAQVAAFAASVRLRSMAQAGVGASTSALQGWVAERGTAVLRHRARRALAVNGSVGLLAGAGLAVLTPWADTLVFGPEVQIDQATAVMLGLACVFYSLSASLSHHVLGPLGRSRAIVRATLVASMVAIPLIYVLTQSFGAAGAMAAVAAAEGLTVVIQGWTARRALAESAASRPSP